MPITGSLGALAYSKIQLADNYEYWYMQTTTGITFSSFTFDNESAFYALGQNSGNSRFHVTKFKEYDDYPYTILTYQYTGTNPLGSPATNYKSTDIIYNTVDNLLVVAGSYSIPYWPVFPYNTVTAGVSFTLPKTLDVGPGTTFQYLDWGNEPQNFAVRYYQSLDFDSSNGNLYFAGYATTSTTGGPNSFFIRKKNDIDSTTTANTAITDVVYAFQSGIPDGTTTVKLDSNNDPIYCGITQSTNITNRRVLLRKANKTPGTIGSNTYLPTIWQVQLAVNNVNTGITFQSQDLVIDSSDNIYVLANQSSINRSFIAKFDSSGVLQWQIRLENVMCKSICLDSNDDIYVLGSNTINNLYVAKFTKTSGTVSWQRQLSGFTYTGEKILNVGSNLYIMGNATGNGFMMKVPNDGSIPGTGTYQVLGATIVYSSASASPGTASLVITTPADVDLTNTPISNSVGQTQFISSLPTFILGLT